jgi:hypothetical protein
MIEEVSASDRLRKKVLAHYNQFGATWKDKGLRKVIRISQDEETIALASALAFQLCGNGSLSELGRLLIRFYAVERGAAAMCANLSESSKSKVALSTIIKANVVTIRPRGAQGDSEPKIASSFTLDEETVSLLGLLIQRMHMKSNELVSHLVEKYAANEDLLKDLRQSPAWDEQVSAQHTVLKRFNFSHQIDSLLVHLSYTTLGCLNKSAMIRALIRIESDLQELRSVPPARRRRTGHDHK